MQNYFQPIGLLLSCALLGCGSPKKADETKETKKAAVVAEPTNTTKPTEPKPLSPPAFVKEKQVLYDPRIPLPEMTPLPEEEQEKILSKIYPKRLKKREECAKSERFKTTEEDVAAGQIAPEVIAYATGSFTGPGLSQTMYAIDLNECNVDEMMVIAQESWDTDVYIFTKGELTHTFISTYVRGKIKLVDVDQDGVQEVLSVLRPDAGMFGGYEIPSLDGFAKTPEDTKVYGMEVPRVLEDSCSVTEASVDLPDGFKPGIWISVVSYTPTERGKAPTYSEEKLVATCEKGAPYTPAP